ncbi:MAG: hypothetical protein LBT40_11910 [Deltaproteobacteria bacterium]|jgi:hypothetical protein|nr:hypothetical protein [Deltaproteobacteria bacterium]
MSKPPKHPSRFHELARYFIGGEPRSSSSEPQPPAAFPAQDGSEGSGPQQERLQRPWATRPGPRPDPPDDPLPPLPRQLLPSPPESRPAPPAPDSSWRPELPGPPGGPGEEDGEGEGEDSHGLSMAEIRARNWAGQGGYDPAGGTGTAGFRGPGPDPYVPGGAGGWNPGVLRRALDNVAGQDSGPPVPEEENDVEAREEGEPGQDSESRQDEDGAGWPVRPFEPPPPLPFLPPPPPRMPDPFEPPAPFLSRDALIAMAPFSGTESSGDAGPPEDPEPVEAPDIARALRFTWLSGTDKGPGPGPWTPAFAGETESEKGPVPAGYGGPAGGRDLPGGPGPAEGPAPDWYPRLAAGPAPAWSPGPAEEPGPAGDPDPAEDAGDAGLSVRRVRTPRKGPGAPE